MNLSQLLQHAYRDLGKVAPNDEFVATGGSATTIINTEIATRPVQYDDGYGYNFTAFVVRDAAGAAPEGEFSAVSAYTSSTSTFTIGTLTAAVGAGDTIMLANDLIPLRTMIELANRMLKDLGRIELIDTSLTTAADQTEYTLPLVAKYSVRRFEVQGQTGDANDNQYEKVYLRDVVPAAPGSTGLLVLPQFSAGYTIKLWYEGVHPTLSVYSSTISETVDEDLAIKGLCAYALQWYNRAVGGDDYWRQEEANAWRAFDEMKRMRPVVKSPMIPKYFTRE